MEKLQHYLECEEQSLIRMKYKVRTHQNRVSNSTNHQMKFVLKMKCIIILVLKSMVNNTPMTYYLSVCKKFRDTLFDGLDIPTDNEGDYLDWTECLKEMKEIFDYFIDVYTDYKIKTIK